MIVNSIFSLNINIFACCGCILGGCRDSTLLSLGLEGSGR